MRAFIIAIALAATGLVAACSSDQIYNSGQAWRRSTCDQMADREQRDRCLKEADRSYDSFKKEADKAAAP